MKIILLQDVKGVGRKSDIKDVNDGYANNFLLPKKLALFASDASVKKVLASKKVLDAEREIMDNLARKSAEVIKGSKIKIEKKGNDKGHLFAAVHAEEIADALKEQIKVTIDPEYISIPKPIKEKGEHEVLVKIQDIQTKFIVEVIV